LHLFLEYMTEKRLLEVIEFCRSTNSWADLNRYLGSIFFKPESLMASFPVELTIPTVTFNPSSKELLRSAEFEPEKDVDERVNMRSV
jgi:hypothetical protein